MNNKSFTDNRLVLKNTLMLYIRQILILFISLFTSRIVLKALGSTDFGIYNLVGGIATMLGFLSSAMVIACQRYFSFYIGQRDKENLKKAFTTSIYIYLAISIIIILFAETIGIWFINNILVIPSNRLLSANFVYQFSLISFVVTVLGTPFTAIIVSYEKMEIYARISVFECLLKVFMAYMLNTVLIDKLSLYGFFMMLISFIVTSCYIVYCSKIISISYFKFDLFDKNIFFKMGKFISWNLLGNISGTVYNLGSNILVNLFFGPTINTAKSIASQINSSVNSFASQFSSAIRPQLVKNYASYNYKDMLIQLYNGTKITFFLIYIFVLPLSIEMPFVLKLWLGEYPQYTVQFAILILIATCIEVTTYALDTVAQATGDVKNYQLFISTLYLLNIPISFVFLSLGAKPYIIIVIYSIIVFFSIIVRVIIIHFLIKEFSVFNYCKDVLLRIIILVIATIPIPIICSSFFEDGFFRLIIITLISVIEVIGFSYFILFSAIERNIIKEKIKKYFWRLKKL